MFDLGDSVALTATVPTGSTNTTVTITQPDGTQVGPTVALSGTYTFVPTQSGRHTVQWLSTGGPGGQQAYGDAFDVAIPDPGFVISLADVKAQLNMTSTANDEELRMWLGAATDIIEDLCGAMVPRTYTETHDGGKPTIVVYNAPIISVSSITEYIGTTAYPLTLQPYGSAVNAYGFTVDDPAGGVITRRGAASFPQPFFGTQGAVTVTYKAGRLVMPYAVQAAARIIVQHLWTTRRGAMPLPAQGSDGTDLIAGAGYAIPNAALELLRRYERTPGIA